MATPFIDIAILIGVVAVLAAAMVLALRKPAPAPLLEGIREELWAAPPSSFVGVAPRHAIFISYRRMDLSDLVGRLYEKLTHAFGPELVFKDVNSIPTGTDFREQISRALRGCRVGICVIGPNWFGDPKTGDSRLDDKEDFVRIEIETLLGQKVWILPVYIHDMPVIEASQVPASLEKLAYLQKGVLRSDPDFEGDCRALIADISKILGVAR